MVCLTCRAKDGMMAVTLSVSVKMLYMDFIDVIRSKGDITSVLSNAVYFFCT